MLPQQHCPSREWPTFLLNLFRKAFKPAKPPSPPTHWYEGPSSHDTKCLLWSNLAGVCLSWSVTRGVQKKRRRGHTKWDSWCPPLLLKPPYNALSAFRRKGNRHCRTDRCWWPMGLQRHQDRPRGTNYSRGVKWPRSCCHIFSCSDRRRRNLSVRPQNLTIRETVGKAISQMVLISNQRY